MFCCSRRGKSAVEVSQAEMSYLEKKTRFQKQELIELKKRFQRMSNNSNFITKMQFRENMGLLGLGTVYYLSDRIFDVLDEDKDGKIRFEDFAMYFDKISYGDQKEKAEISFRLIDKKQKGYFIFSEFQHCVQGIISSWIVMTGQQLSQEIRKQLDYRVKFIFQKMDLDGDLKVTLEEYQQSVVQDPNLLEIFDFLNQGVKEQIEEQQMIENDKDQKIKMHLKELENKLENLLHYLKSDQIIESSRLQKMHSSVKQFQSSESEQIIVQPPHIQLSPQNSKIQFSDQFQKQDPKKKIIQQKQKTNTLFQLDLDPPILLVNENLSPNHQNHVAEQMFSPIDSLLHYNSPPQKMMDFSPIQEASFKFENTFLQQSMQKQSDQTQQVQSLQSFRIIHSKLHPKFFQILPKEIEDTNDIHFNDEDEHNKSDEEVISFTVKQFEQSFDPNIQKLPTDQLRHRYQEAIEQIREITEEVKVIRQKFEVDRLQKEREQLQEQAKEQTLQILKASTVMNIHKQDKRGKPTMTHHKKPKISVAFGHENFNLVLNMMIGIQMAVKSINTADDYVIGAKDFKLKYYFELLPRRAGSEKSTFKVCKFYDYAPQVFNSIRTIYGIDNNVYLKSIGPETLLSSLLRGDLSTLSELTSTGKSGSFFYYTADGRFTLKTIHRYEFQFLREILRSYYQHIKQFNDSLIVKFYGMHKIGIKYHQKMKEKIIYFVIMSNVFNTSKEIHERFDLKGSLYKRETKDTDPTVAKKELNFLKQKMKLQVNIEKKIQFLDQIKKDCKFFIENNIIDYSLLLGIHYKKKKEKQFDSESSYLSDDIYMQQYQDSLSMIMSSNNEIIYYFGIIDILTNFNTKKKLEYVAKRITLGPTISAIPPQDYGDRFMLFNSQIFEEN